MGILGEALALHNYCPNQCREPNYHNDDYDIKNNALYRNS